MNPPFTPSPASDDEVMKTLAHSITRASSGRLGREHACFVATLSAEYLADALAQAGLMVVRTELRSELVQTRCLL